MSSMVWLTAASSLGRSLCTPIPSFSSTRYSLNIAYFPGVERIRPSSVVSSAAMACTLPCSSARKAMAGVTKPIGLAPGIFWLTAGPVSPPFDHRHPLVLPVRQSLHRTARRREDRGAGDQVGVAETDQFLALGGDRDRSQRQIDPALLHFGNPGGRGDEFQFRLHPQGLGNGLAQIDVIAHVLAGLRVFNVGKGNGIAPHAE